MQTIDTRPISGQVNNTRPRVCILARKKLQHNTRVARQARILEAAGFDVVVVSLAKPFESLMARSPKTSYIAIEARPLFMRLMKSGWLKAFPAKPCAPEGESGDTPSKTPRHDILAPVRSVLGLLLVGFLRLAGISPEGEAPTTETVRKIGLGVCLDRVYNAALYFLVTRGFAKWASLAVKDMRVDVVQAHDIDSLLAADRLARQRAVPMVYDAVEMPDDRSGQPMRWTPDWLLARETRMSERIISRAASVMTISNGLADWMADRYGIARPQLVRNCRYFTDFEPNDQIRRDIGLPEEARLILYLNSLYAGQGLEQLLESMVYMSPAAHVATLGPVTQKNFDAQLRKLAEELGVSGRFHILPIKPPDEMLSYASGADFGVVPRQNTSFNNYISLPNRLFELVMARLPLAVSSLPDMRSFVAEYGIGVSFDETQPKSIAKAINELLQPDVLARYRVAVGEAASQLSWDREGEKYVTLVRQALSR